jgi:hypothetical protein
MHLNKNRDIDRLMGSQWILERLGGSVHWIQLAQVRGRWLAPVNTAMNLQVLAPRVS